MFMHKSHEPHLLYSPAAERHRTLAGTATHFTYPGAQKAELAWVAGHKPRWYTRPQTITHPNTNQARRRVTLLIETNALPLSQSAMSLRYSYDGSRVAVSSAACVTHRRSNGPFYTELFAKSFAESQLFYSGQCQLSDAWCIITTSRLYAIVSLSVKWSGVHLSAAGLHLRLYAHMDENATIKTVVTCAIYCMQLLHAIYCMQ